MRDSYQILEVSRNASDEEIKKVYRSLSRKYHPDANVNNPDKVASEEKFKEIQQAYQQIMKERTQGFSDSSQTESGNPYGGFGSFWGFGSYESRQESAYESEESIHLKAAVNYINSGHYQEALNVLSSIANRDARWYYYSACANFGNGNNIIALEHAKRASQMEPGNREFRALVNRFEGGGTWYQSKQSPYGRTATSGGSFCIKLCVANLFCNVCCKGGASGYC
jgi:molecular chaperone DnaJ